MTTPVSNIQTDKFWFNDFGVLFRPSRVTEFFPSSDQTLEERMNSIARLGLYSSLLTMAYKRDFSKIAIFLAILIITYAVYKNYTKEDIMDVEPLYKKNSMKTVKSIEPTLNNPFMNTLVTENPQRGPALEYFRDDKKSENIRKDISEKFNHNLYMGIDDMYEKNNSQRQFYTTPNTSIPSDQEKFLNFMYPNMTSCKDQAKDCKINEDLRGRPFVFPDAEQNPVSGLEL